VDLLLCTEDTRTTVGAPEEQNEGSTYRKFGGGSSAINKRKRKRGARPNLVGWDKGIAGGSGPLTWWRIRGFGDSGREWKCRRGVTESITLMNLLIIKLITQQRRRRRSPGALT